MQQSGIISELSAVERQVIVALGDAHRGGVIELHMCKLADEVMVDSESLASVIQKLAKCGYLDKVESHDYASLSAVGMKLATHLCNIGDEDEEVKDALNDHEGFEKLERQAPQIKEEKISLADKNAFVMRLQECMNGLPEVIEQSNLSDLEKNRLRHLSAELFEHPATFELMKRAIK